MSSEYNQSRHVRSKSSSRHSSSRHSSGESRRRSSKGSRRSGTDNSRNSPDSSLADNTGTQGSRRSTSRSKQGSTGSSGRSRRSHHTIKSRKLVNFALAVVAVVALIAVLTHPRKNKFTREIYDPLAAIPDDLKLVSRIDDRRFTFNIKALDITGNSGYNIIAPVPLKISDVVGLSSDHLALYVPYAELDEWLPDCVTLHRFLNNKWYFTVSYRPADGGANDDGTPRRVEIPVRFNRMVVKGVESAAGDAENNKTGVESDDLEVAVEKMLREESEETKNVAASSQRKYVFNASAKKFVFELTDEQLDQSADCDLLEGVPLEIHQASALALTAFGDYLPADQSSDWHINTVSLKRVDNSDKWYYLVEFTRINDDPDTSVRLRIPVLLSGKVVQGGT